MNIALTLAMLAVFAAVLGWAMLRAALDARREWRLGQRIAEIGHDQARDVVQRLSARDVRERR